ncbi:siderophore-interacting protein [Roseateles sp. NT4]|uniref:siderophore-interacting protein n=1 Tax=Roseateles sp. NT4 TaxID=3453715 RepID=UPI003EEC408D
MSEPTTPVRRIQRVRHELLRRELEVRQVEQLSPNFIAVTLKGESLASFRSDSFDDHVKVFFDETGAEPARRDYTPRRFDTETRELTLEFALHGSGAASDWARQATAGQQLTLGGPRGSMIIPTDYDWHLLIGDDSALPAVHRRLEELPEGSRAIVMLQLGDAGDRRLLTSRANLQVEWVQTADELVSAIAALALPDGEGFAWAAGEASVMARVRQVLVDKRLPKEAMKVAAYWKAGAMAFHETLES